MDHTVVHEVPLLVGNRGVKGLVLLRVAVLPTSSSSLVPWVLGADGDMRDELSHLEFAKAALVDRIVPLSQPRRFGLEQIGLPRGCF